MTTTTQSPICINWPQPTGNPRNRRCGHCHADYMASRPVDTPAGPPPVARSVDWPSLMVTAERRGIPALRVDPRGNLHILRTLKQLRTEWEN